MAHLQRGARIANSRGVPGTLGCIAYTLHDGRPVLLSTWHVLFGNDAREESAVWLLDEFGDGHRFSGIGKTLYGKIGTLQFAGEDYYVDCAVASCTQVTPVLANQTRTALTTVVAGYEAARLGSVVTKTGAATGVTRGTVVDVRYSDSTFVKGSAYSKPRQMLVRPLEGHDVFSAEGDSGALIVDASNKAVGLLWGTNVRGEGVACPIAPVLYAMNITLDPARLAL